MPRLNDRPDLILKEIDRHKKLKPFRSAAVPGGTMANQTKVGRQTLAVDYQATTIAPAAAEPDRVRADDTAILEFFERRKRRAQAVRAREIAREAIGRYHEQGGDKFAEMELHLALEQEQQAERAYLDPLHFPPVG
jgi:hypothetical protein